MSPKSADFQSPAFEKQYLENASPLAPPPPPIKVGAAISALDYLTGLANADSSLFPVPEISDLTIRNRRLATVAAADRVTRLNVSLSTQLQSQITIEMEDPDFRLLGSGILQGQPAVVYKQLQLELAGVATIDRNRGALSLKARSAKVQALKRRRGPLTVIGDERSFIGYECDQVGLPFVSVLEEGNTLGPEWTRRVSRDWQPYTVAAALQDFDEIPSSWTTFKRLADQRGWLLFEANNVLYFAPPSWLFTNSTMVRVRYSPTSKIRAEKWKPSAIDRKARAVVVDSSGGQYWKTLIATGDYDPGVIECISVPVFDHSQDRIETTLSFKVAVKDVLHFLPGKVVDFHGVPNFDGLYLCMSVTYDVTGPDATITAQTPVDPQPQAGSTFAGFGTGTSTLTGVGSDLTGSSSDRLGLPACGITMTGFLKGLRQTESGGNYKSPPASAGGASGAYQYIESTWQAVAPAAVIAKYPQAYLAPADLQDQVAETNVNDALQTYNGDWGKVAADHLYPPTADKPRLWKYRPFMEPGGNPPAGYDPQSNPRVIDYVRKVLKLAGGIACPTFEKIGSDTKLATDMVTVALSQVGKPYSETVAIDYEHTSNPSTYDCSSLVQWSCAQVGVTDMPRNSGDQWDHCKRYTIDVAVALKVRGALLWIDDPGVPGGQHVAISMGDGKRELAAHTSHAPLAQQINVRPTDAAEWNRAALIPGIDYTGSGWTP